MEYKSFYKVTDTRKANTWCLYTKRLDTYGKGCQHDCSYCYAKSLLNFRGLWDSKNPSIANIDKIIRLVGKLDHSPVRLGGMTDCFQPIEKIHRVTYETIKELNKNKIPYLIVTKSDMVAFDEYIDIYDKDLAHFQITVTFTDDANARNFENCSPPSLRIKAIERLYNMGFDVSVRLSPFVYSFIDVGALNSINCNKILIEFLKVNHWVKSWFKIDYSEYSLKYGGYNHLQLERKIELASIINGFDQMTVGEYVYSHHNYFSKNFNFNEHDCCNLNLT